MKLKYLLNLAYVYCFIICTNTQAASISDQQIKQMIIQESIQSYSGNCACPYNLMRNGRKSGVRSAWSKRGGYAPICYAGDISKEMVNEWRAKHLVNEKNVEQ